MGRKNFQDRGTIAGGEITFSTHSCSQGLEITNG